MEEAKNQVLALIEKAATTEVSHDAVRFAEAAVHAAHALLPLDAVFGNPSPDAGKAEEAAPKVAAEEVLPPATTTIAQAAPSDNPEGAPAAAIATDHAA